MFQVAITPPSASYIKNIIAAFMATVSGWWGIGPVVEDIVQTVFIKALESLQSLEKPELFYYWLFTIARNESRVLSIKTHQ